MSQPNDALAADIKELVKAAETVDVPATDDTPPAPTPSPVADASIVEAPKPADSIEEETLSEEDALLVSKISSLSPDARKERIEKLEKSGRPNHIKVAEMLRETHGLEEVKSKTIDQEVLQAAVAAELERQGLNKEDLQAQRDETSKIQALESALKEKGQDPALATKIARSPEFIKTYYSDKYAGLDMSDRVELALGKTKKFVTPTQGPGIATPAGNKETVAAPDDTSMEGMVKAMQTALMK